MMNIRRSIQTSLVCLIVVLTICDRVAAQNQSATSTSTQRLQLEPCRLTGWSEDVRCGKYEVYEDRRAKSGRKIALRIVVLPALNSSPAADPVFHFAGGPGGSSVETVTRSGKSYLAALRRDRDLVFVDQRGTGDSNPLRCNLFGDRNDMAAYFRDLFSAERLRSCRTELEKIADLSLYSTPIAMDDLDEVRAALGYGKINLYGGSYGSTAAMVYLRQFPQNVRTAVLLGVAPPDMSLPLPFAKGVQNALDRLFADCAADEKCREAFPDPRKDLNTASARLEKEPATFEAFNPFTKTPQILTFSRGAFVELVRSILYIPEYSRWLPLMLNQSAKGQFGLFVTIGFQVSRSIDDQIARGMHFSVACAEDIAFITDAEATREMAGSFYGDYRMKAYRRACEIWPRANIPASFSTPVKSDVPALLISGEADPVTPPWIAEAAARHLANSRHVVIPHTGHSFSFSCVDSLISTFISSGSVKGLDVSCLTQIRRPPFLTEEMLNAMANSQTADSNKPVGQNEQVWQGVLDVGQAKLRLVLRLSKAADGKVTGKVDSPDQGANGLPIDTITWKDQTLSFEMRFIGAVYEGRVSADSSEITGQWHQGGQSWPLNFKRPDK